MRDEEIIKFCIEQKITVEQFYFMWLVVRKDWNMPYANSLAKQYLKEVGAFDEERVVKPLIQRGLIMDLNTPPYSKPEFFIVPDEVINLFYVTEDVSEELWENYPPQFPLGDGGFFLARVGDNRIGGKEEILALYRSKIKNSPKKHKFVIEQLTKYSKLVQDRRINGYKIGDFILSELWDTIHQITSDNKLSSRGGHDYARDI